MGDPLRSDGTSRMQPTHRPILRRAIVVAVAALAALKLAFWLLMGEGPSVNWGPPMAVAALLGWNTWRDGIGRERFPPRFWIATGAVLLGIYGLFLTRPQQPSAASGWLGFALIMAIPAAMLAYGLVRRARGAPWGGVVAD